MTLRIITDNIVDITKNKKRKTRINDEETETILETL